MPLVLKFEGGPWTCFHCGETFTIPTDALMHFGDNESYKPACRLKEEDGDLLLTVRRQQRELDRYRAEDSDTDRAMHALRDEHARALRRAEEEGYAKGLRDGRALGPDQPV